MTGQTISHYRILDKLGEGGMGVVYKAEDTKLRRTVALKFLPPHATENRERFLREAQAAAALNHPNICTVFEIDDEHGFQAMEYIEGQSLKDKIAARPLPLEQALDIALQACQGLQAAHEKGVVHRDIKPANLMLTAQGQVKIMDFGLAQVGDRTRITKTGASLGTPAYMSPEQAKGEAVDRRTDIWSLGVVLYEMIAGRLPFRGDTDQAVAYGITHSHPEPLTALRTGLPLQLDHIAAKALAKDPAARYQHVDDFRVDLAGMGNIRHTAPRSRPPWFYVAGGAAAAIAVASLIAVLALTKNPRHQIPGTKHLTLLLEPGHILNQRGAPFAISSDGRRLVYVAGFEASNLVLKSLDSGDTTPVQGTYPAMGPFFSYDDKWIGFTSNGQLRKISLGGGAAVALCDTADAWQANGASWTPEGIFFSAGPSGSNGIARVLADGGTPVPVTVVKPGESGHVFPQVLPGGRAILFTLLTSTQPPLSQAAVQSIATGERRIVMQNASGARYLSSGHLAFAKGSDIYAVPFDLGRLEALGSPVRVVQGPVDGRQPPSFAVAEDGTLGYAPAVLTTGRSLVWADRSGVTKPLGLPPRVYVSPKLSPDGKRIAVSVIEGDRVDLWVYRLGGDLNRLTSEGILAAGSQWTPDSSALTFAAREGGKWAMFRQSIQAGSVMSRLFIPTGRVAGLWPGSWSPDGSALVYMQLTDGDTQGDLMLFSARANGEPQPHVQTRSQELGGRLSRDGKWMAYVSNDSGRFEVYIRPFPGAGNRVQVSSEGGTGPVWARNGRELFYWSGQKFMAAQIQTSPALEVGKRIELFQGSFVRGRPGEENFDVSVDDTQFLMMQESKPETGSLNIVVNWFEELKRRVPPPR